MLHGQVVLLDRITSYNVCYTKLLRLVVSLTTITGYVLGKGHLDGGWLKVTVGIFLMACGASVLNHLQEIRSDAQMERTRNRPLPGGHLAKQAAWLLAGTEVLLGTLVLGLGVNALAACLGWLALLWYNGVYTRLKRLTPHRITSYNVCYTKLLRQVKVRHLPNHKEKCHHQAIHPR